MAVTLRRGILILLLVLVPIACLSVVLWFFRNEHDSAKLKISWTRGGQARLVSGRVVDLTGRPVPGIDVNLDDDSGGQSATSDANGRFSVHLGESDLLGVEVCGVEEVKLRQPLGVSVESGLDLQIMIKTTVPGIASRPVVQ